MDKADAIPSRRAFLCGGLALIVASRIEPVRQVLVAQPEGKPIGGWITDLTMYPHADGYALRMVCDIDPAEFRTEGLIGFEPSSWNKRWLTNELVLPSGKALDQFITLLTGNCLYFGLAAYDRLPAHARPYHRFTPYPGMALPIVPPPWGKPIELFAPAAIR